MVFRRQRVHLAPQSDEVIDATCERLEDDYLVDRRLTGWYIQQCRERRGPFGTFRKALAMCLTHAEQNSYYPNFFVSELDGNERLITQAEIDEVLSLNR